MPSKLEDHLKKHHLRNTNARQVLYKILSRSRKALSAQDVFEKVKRTSHLKTDQASVYRNLTLFTEIGLTHRLQNGKYSICSQEDHRHESHLHIIATCVKCEKTYEIESHSNKLEQLVGRFKDQMRSFGRFSGITLQGTCRLCLKKNQGHL